MQQVNDRLPQPETSLDVPRWLPLQPSLDPPLEEENGTPCALHLLCDLPDDRCITPEDDKAKMSSTPPSNLPSSSNETVTQHATVTAPTAGGFEGGHQGPVLFASHAARFGPAQRHVDRSPAKGQTSAVDIFSMRLQRLDCLGGPTTQVSDSLPSSLCDRSSRSAVFCSRQLPLPCLAVHLDEDATCRPTHAVRALSELPLVRPTRTRLRPR